MVWMVPGALAPSILNKDFSLSHGSFNNWAISRGDPTHTLFWAPTPQLLVGAHTPRPSRLVQLHAEHSHITKRNQKWNLEVSYM